jgi:hypothetical protein
VASEVPFSRELPAQYDHAVAITRDLSEPSSVNPLCIAGDYNGTYSYLLRVYPNVESQLTSQGLVTNGNGIVMGTGYFGSYTLFISNIAVHDRYQNVSAQIGTFDMSNPGQNQYVLPQSVGGNFSDPTGPTIYHTSGGSAAAAPNQKSSPQLVDLGTSLSDVPMVAAEQPVAPSAVLAPTMPAVLLPSLPPLLLGVGEAAPWSAAAAPLPLGRSATTELDSWFAALGSRQTL